MATTGASVQLIRNATILLDVGDTTFLVDPMFTPEGEMPTVTDNPAVPEFLTTANQDRNPLVPLPDVDLTYDAVVVTHRHPDHWDEAAREELDADVPLFCQPEEADAFTDEGFTDVRPVDDETTFEGVTIHRTPGQHGHGDLAEEWVRSRASFSRATRQCMSPGTRSGTNRSRRHLTSTNPIWWFSTAAKRSSIRANPSRWGSRTSTLSERPLTPK
ncbi:MBL fold metallo-hydrolase [Haloarcula litorea]|uniref:MBL fold metallo-hydrolase n=1 Tax=Haloarcula litorea TaxID=3032579 RepID=UPI0023E7F064|nr:MBL fold metallo-hydrolase [Halomicroarcula sp. GDY20]